MIVLSLTICILLIMIPLTNYYRKKEISRVNSVRLKANIFAVNYRNKKSDKVIDNICNYEFDKVLKYVKSFKKFRLHTNTINHKEIDYIIEILDPKLKSRLQRQGFPNTSLALNKYELSTFYYKCTSYKVNMFCVIFDHHENLEVLGLCTLHYKFLKEQIEE